MTTPIFVDSDYQRALLALLPRGKVWPRDLDGLQTHVLGAFAPTYRRSGDRGLALLVDAFPATTFSLLQEWEESLGLPDPCAGEAPTLQARQKQVVARFTNSGGQSIPYIVAFAAALGYTITVTQYQPFRCGQSRAGDQLGTQDWAFYWTANAPLQTITYFRTGVSACGEPLEDWGGDVLQCELDAVKPAHTLLAITES